MSRCLVFVVFLVINLSFFPPPAQAEQKAIEFAIGNGYSPFIDEVLPQGGVFREIVETAVSRVGAVSITRVVPWARAKKLARAGRVHATYSWGWSEEHQLMFLLGKPLACLEQRLFAKNATLAASPKLSNDDYAKVTGKVCFPQDWTLAPTLARAVEEGRLVRMNPQGMSNCFDMLRIGRVDFVQAEPISASILMNDMRQNDVKWGELAKDAIDYAKGEPLQSSRSHILFSQNRSDGREWSLRLSKELQKMDDDGITEKIWMRHLAHHGLPKELMPACREGQ